MVRSEGLFGTYRNSIVSLVCTIVLSTINLADAHHPPPNSLSCIAWGIFASGQAIFAYVHVARHLAALLTTGNPRGADQLRTTGEAVGDVIDNSFFVASAYAGLCVFLHILDFGAGGTGRHFAPLPGVARETYLLFPWMFYFLNGLCLMAGAGPIVVEATSFTALAVTALHSLVGITCTMTILLPAFVAYAETRAPRA